MKLQLLVPQYKETEEIVKPLLDSLAIQQGIDLNEVGVIICNDGSDVRLSKSFLNSYPLKLNIFCVSIRVCLQLVMNVLITRQQIT